MEMLKEISSEILSLKEEKKLLIMLIIVAFTAFFATYIHVAKEEAIKAEEKAKTEIVFKFLTE